MILSYGHNNKIIIPLMLRLHKLRLEGTVDTAQ